MKSVVAGSFLPRWLLVPASLLLAFIALGEDVNPSAAPWKDMPPNPRTFQVHQPDGDRITLRLRGSARHHWLEDVQGFPVVRSQGRFVYGHVDDSGTLYPTALEPGRADPQAARLKPARLAPPRPVSSPSLASAAPDLNSAPVYSRRAALPSGRVRNLVIPMRFADHATRLLPSTAQLNALFNAQGGDPTNAPTGSVRDYYAENSYGQLTLESTVLPWIPLPRTETYYADGISGVGTRFKEALATALNAADLSVDFRDFDNDNNGWIDAITFIHSGYAAEWGAADADGVSMDDRIWSHRAGMPTFTSAEGVRVLDYSVSSAFFGVSGRRITHVGVIVHELGHFFGLPDLYDTDGSSAGAGTWCGMANSWGWSGDQLYPPHFSAYCKVQLGWIRPTLLTAPGLYSLPPVQQHPAVFMVTNGFAADEYLLIENRQPIGFDAEIEQGGLAVWHIDETVSDNDNEGYPDQPGWPENGLHYRVALVQADGRYDLERLKNQGDAEDLITPTNLGQPNPAPAPGFLSYTATSSASPAKRILLLEATDHAITFSYQDGTPGLRLSHGLPTSTGFQLTLTGAPGTAWALETSTNTTDWSSLLSGSIPFAGATNLLDPDSAQFPRRFYRLQP